MALNYDPERDFYKLLGLGSATGVTEQAVRRAYLECARKAHPDRDRTNDAATGNFQDIQQAYEILKDDAKRAKYDRLRLDGLRREEIRKRDEAARKRTDEGWGRGGNRRRQGGQGTQQYGPEKYYPFDQRVPKPAAPPKPSNAYSAWAEMGRANGTGKFGPSAYQAHAQKQSGDAKARPGPHPTAKIPKKPAPQRPGSFAQGGWAKDGPSRADSPGKNGYRPTSSTMGDEPRAKNNSYSSNSRPKPFTGGYDASDEADSDNLEAILKDRRSQPYQGVHGEKTKLFTGPKEKESSSGEAHGPKPQSTPTKPPQGPPQGEKLNGQDPWAAPTTPQGFSFKPPNDQGVNAAGHESDRPSVFKNPTENPASWFKPPDSAFAFTAGSSTPQPPLRKTRSSGVVGRKQSPVKRNRPPSTPGPKQAPDRMDSESPSKFDANAWLSGPNDWREKVAPQTFPSQPNPHPPHVSPVRQPQTRSTLKRAATTSRPTSTTPRAATVEDVSDTKGAPVTGHHRAKETRSVPMDSPTAMDIDSPSPPRPVPAPAQTPTQAPRTRGVPVEPTKPEWRHGNAGESSKAKKRSSADRPRPVKPAAGGSEDTDEFHEILKDFKNVYPIAPQASGLSSFDDLKTTLPFTSQPSENIPLSRTPEKKVKSLTIPDPPVAPMFPNGVKPTPDFAAGHRQRFDAYRKQWTDYNMIMVDHFRSRQAQVAAAAAARAQKGHGQGKGNEGSYRAALAQEVEWMRLDREARKRWDAACDKHERNLQDHLAWLDKTGS